MNILGYEIRLSVKREDTGENFTWIDASITPPCWGRIFAFDAKTRYVGTASYFPGSGYYWGCSGTPCNLTHWAPIPKLPPPEPS